MIIEIIKTQWYCYFQGVKKDLKVKRKVFKKGLSVFMYTQNFCGITERSVISIKAYQKTSYYVKLLNLEAVENF